MGSLTAGVLVKLLQSMHNVDEVKVLGEHRKAVLQVISIVPAVRPECESVWSPDRGFYLKVSDSSHATYATLAEEDRHLVLANKLVLGQLIQVSRLEPGSPHPILRGLTPLPTRQRSFSFGNPEEICVPSALRSALNVKSTRTLASLLDSPSTVKSTRSLTPVRQGPNAGASAIACSPRLASAFGESESARKCWKGAKYSREKVRSVSTTDEDTTFVLQASHPSSPQVTVENTPERNSISNSKEPKSNGTVNSPYSAVKVPLSNQRLTSEKGSWEALPKSFVDSGRKALQWRDAALLAAVEALQEASLAESVLRNLSMFADLCMSAKQDEPQSSVEQFLNINAGLGQAVSVANALVKMRKEDKRIQDEDSRLCFLRDASSISADKRKGAMSWVLAALSSDLSALTLLRKQTTHTVPKARGKETPPSNPLHVCLEASAKRDAQRNLAASSKPYAERSKVSEPSIEASSKSYAERSKVSEASLSSSRKPSRPFSHKVKSSLRSSSNQLKQAVLNDCENKVAKSVSPSKQTGIASGKGSCKSLTKGSSVNSLKTRGYTQSAGEFLSTEWAKGKGLDDTADLAQKLLFKVQNWFLNFIEGSLDLCLNNLQKGRKGNEANESGAQNGRYEIVTMMSQLKKVGDWLNEATFPKEDADAYKTESKDPQFSKALLILKTKIYDFLLKSLDSASFTLGTQTFEF